MAASGDQNDLDALSVYASKGRQIGFGNPELRIKQGTVNIDGDEADGIGKHSQF